MVDEFDETSQPKSQRHASTNEVVNEPFRTAFKNAFCQLTDVTDAETETEHVYSRLSDLYSFVGHTTQFLKILSEVYDVNALLM